MMQDRDISDSRWKRYIKKHYGGKYRVFCDELGVWNIKCKYGFVQPYSIVKKELVAVLSYKSGRGINSLLRKLQTEQAPNFRITQRGDCEVCIAFNEKDAEKFAELLAFGHKRQVSEAQRKILTERVKTAHEKWLKSAVKKKKKRRTTVKK